MKIMKTIIYAFALTVAMMVSGVAFAQNSMTVTGTVKDSKGEPIIGAAVMVEGTTVGVVTDIDGKYVISFTPKDGKVTELSYASISYCHSKSNCIFGGNNRWSECLYCNAYDRSRI